MEIAEINLNDIINSMTGVTISIWVNGCPHRCKGCHNENLWMPDKRLSIYNIYPVYEYIKKNIMIGSKFKDISFLGGEPLFDNNKKGVSELINLIRNDYGNKINIYLWTGYTLDYLKKLKDKDINIILKNITYLIDGPFIEEKKDLSLKLRGSYNQNIYLNKNGKLKKIN